MPAVETNLMFTDGLVLFLTDDHITKAFVLARGTLRGFNNEPVTMET